MVERVAELSAKLDRIPVLIPTEDQYAQVIARHRPQIDEFATACVAGSEVVDTLIDKQRFSDWARNHSVRHPISIAAIEYEPDRELGFPVVAKPRFPFHQISECDLPYELRCVVLNDVQAWNGFQRRYQRYLPHLLVQEFVHGTAADMISIGLYADRDSDIRGLFVGRKIRGHPPLFGDTRAGQNDVVPNSVLREVSRVVNELGYTGLAEFEYKVDKNIGEHFLIEINPRSWSWIGITLDTPADIPWIAYQDLTGGAPPKTWHNKDPGSIKYARVMLDFLNVVVRYRWAYPSLAMSPLAWWRTLNADRLVMAEFGRGDWPLAFWSFLHLFKYLRPLILRRRKQL
jgi:predicted ATP-grasp superfamily ATP-dependent carboligase